MKLFTIMAIVLPVQALAGVTVSPSFGIATPGAKLAFSATEADVIWQVNNVTGGTGQAGTIDAAGQFIAPTTLPSPGYATVTAVAPDGTSATAVISLQAMAPGGNTYYVAPGGSDTNAGTINAPFATLQKASSVVKPGDAVFARAGIYNALFTPKVSGTRAAPILFASYPGETAIIDGTGLAIPGGQYGLVTLKGVNDLIIEGFEIRNYTTDSVNDVPAGLFLSGVSDGVQIIRNHIHDITTTAITTPKQCGSDAFGLAVYGNKAPIGITNLVVAGNEVNNLKTGCSESLTINGNVNGFAVVSNLVHDNNNIGIDAIGFERTSPQVAYDQARNGVFRGNTVYNITSYGNPDYGNQYAADGIYVDGGTQLVVEQNIVHNADLGIEIASEHRGRLSSYVIARNNLLYNNNSNGISIGGYAPGKGGSDHITIVNNTLYGNDTKQTGSGEFQIQYHATNNIFANNIVYAGAQGLFVHDYTASTPMPVVLSNNLYFGAIGSARAAFTWQHKAITGFAAFQTASGQDVTSAFADPQFTSATALEFQVLTGSPAVGAGQNFGSAVLGVADLAGQVFGAAIAVGAYQR